MPTPTNFDDEGFAAAERFNGDMNAFEVGLENIRTGYLNDPTVEFTLPEHERQFIIGKIESLKTRIAGNSEKAERYEKLRIEKMTEKQEIRKTSQEYKLATSGSSTIKILFWLLTVIGGLSVMYFYSVFSLHQNVSYGTLSEEDIPSMGNALLPNFLYVKLILENTGSLIYGFVVLLVTILFDQDFGRTRRTKILLKFLFGFVVVFIDVSLAFQAHNVANLHRGDLAIGIFEDTTFWTVISYGTISAFAFGGILHQVMKKTFHKMQQDLYENNEVKLRADEMHAKETSREHLGKIEADTAMTGDLTRTLNGVYIPLNVLLERLHDYFNGWLRYVLNKRRGAIADGTVSEEELSTPYKEALDRKIERVRDTFNQSLEGKR